MKHFFELFISKIFEYTFSLSFSIGPYFFELLIAISLLVQNSEQKLPLCEVVTNKVCTKSLDYVAELEPIPLPNKIDTKIKFFEGFTGPPERILTW